MGDPLLDSLIHRSSPVNVMSSSPRIPPPASPCSRPPGSYSRRSGRPDRGSRPRNKGQVPAGFRGSWDRLPRARPRRLVTSAFSNPSVPRMGRQSSLSTPTSRRRSSRDRSGPMPIGGIAAASIRHSASRRGSSPGKSEERPGAPGGFRSGSRWSSSLATRRRRQVEPQRQRLGLAAAPAARLTSRIAGPLSPGG